MKFEVIIIGGGIVGLATALRLIEKNPTLTIAILEKEASIAHHQTGNNSGVIHSGIYYKPGSLKATNCIEGRKRLIQFCDEHGISYDLCGKIIVATKESELPYLNKLFDQGIANGLDGIRKISADEIHEYEPHVIGIAGIHVPQTGIIDYRVVAAKYGELFQKLGGQIFLDEAVKKIIPKSGYTEIRTSRGVFEAGIVVNCAGLHSDRIARMTNRSLDVRIIPFRGEYYKIRDERRDLVKNLVYPVPDPAFPFLGVHFTRHINDEIEAGPNAVFALKREGYGRLSFNGKDFLESILWPGFQKIAMKYWKTGAGEMYRSFSKAGFVRALQKLIPEISESDLIPGGAGVRAQACARDGTLVDDFMILDNHRQIDVLNVPSPAATSSLSIGETISDMVIKNLR
jgi:L-2-hydroxyglutarate oxidase